MNKYNIPVKKIQMGIKVRGFPKLSRQNAS